MPLWSVGGRQSQRGTVLSQARSDPLLTPHWAPPSPLGSSVCCRVRQAMGLCAGFAVADFKPICGGKIGLVYRPSFILHILFVNPTNYIFPWCRHSLLPCFLSFAHTDGLKKKVTATVRIKYGSQHWHTVTVGYKMPTTVSTQTKGPLFTQKATAVQQLEEDHMVKKKQETIMLLQSYHKIVFCFCFLSLSRSPPLPHTHSHTVDDQLATS